MNKILLRSFILAAAFVLLRPADTHAQPPGCPMGIFNTGRLVGLTNDYLYNTFTTGDYYVTLANTNFTTGATCFSITDQVVHVTKTPNVAAVIPGAGIAAGIVFDFTASACEGGGDFSNLQVNSTSIIVRNVLGADPFLAVDYTDNDPNFCDYHALPVTFGPFSGTLVSGPTRVRLNWTTYMESNVNHFTIEKSINGGTFYKIAQVPAAGNSTSTNNYQFYDNSPNGPNGYYRIVSVDNDCRRNYTIIIRVACSTCPTVFNPPNLSDCAPPVPYVYGPTAICDSLTGRKAYKLEGLRGDIRVTWSIYPSYLANLTQVNRIVGLTPTGNTGIGTLTATVVKNGVTSYYSMNITFGTPPLWVWTSSTPPDNCNQGQFTATVSMYPGTSGSNYYWYQNGWFLGTSDHWTWTIPYPGYVVNYEVRYNGVCGQSIYYGSSDGGLEPFKGNPKPEPRYQIAPNPARSNIVITRRIPPCELPPVDPWKTSSPKSTLGTKIETVIVKVFDMNGNIRKTSKVNVTDTRIEIRAGDLQPGLYYVSIIQAGKDEEKLKVWLEK
jgi:hypothetical protein